MEQGGREQKSSSVLVLIEGWGLSVICYVSFQFRIRQFSPLFGGYCLMFLGGVSLRRTSVGKIHIESVER